MPKSKKDLNTEWFPQLADTLAKDKEFSSIVGHSSPNRAKQLDTIIRNIAPTVRYAVSASSQSISHNFVMNLARTPSNILSVAAWRLQDMFIEYTKAKLHRKRSHKNVTRCTGFIGNEINAVNGLLADVPIIELDPLPMPYPPERHIVLESLYSTLPSPPKLRDPNCNYLYEYCELDNAKLQYTVDVDKEAIFINKSTKDLILIVLRDFTKDYFRIIQLWSVNLILDSISCHNHYVLRNEGGKMAHVGVSPGHHSGSVFRCVHNLKKTKKVAVGLEDHQYDISSLFRFFYGLICGRLPKISDDFERAMKHSGIPHLDPTGSKWFTLPFTYKDITFDHHPFAPPKRYISHNFSPGIHSESCWTSCP